MEEEYIDRTPEYEEGKVPANPIPRSMVKVFAWRLEEMSKKYPERNLMLFKLGIKTGYRMQDLVDLRVGDVRIAISRGYFEIQEKKQYNRYLTFLRDNPTDSKRPPRKRRLFIYKNLIKDLEEYMDNYLKNPKNSDFMFPSTGDHGYITAKSYSRILRKVGMSLGLEHISGHSLRKTYIRKVFDDSGKSYEVARDDLGHSDIEITRRYLNESTEVKKKNSKKVDEFFDF